VGRKESLPISGACLVPEGTRGEKTGYRSPLIPLKPRGERKRREKQNPSIRTLVTFRLLKGGKLFFFGGKGKKEKRGALQPYVCNFLSRKKGGGGGGEEKQPGLFWEREKGGEK